jgi:hypothetical protein
MVAENPQVKKGSFLRGLLFHADSIILQVLKMKGAIEQIHRLPHLLVDSGRKYIYLVRALVGRFTFPIVG